VRRLALPALLAVACSVGQGTGSVTGPLTILDCGGAGKNFPTAAKPAQEFDLHAQFFGAEQLLDLSMGQSKQHRLIIRLQNTGRRREVSDILRFDITNLFEVARCVRGDKKPDGSDDFDTRDCARGPDGVRVRVGPNALVRASITPNFTCSTKLQIYDHVGTADSMTRSPNDGNWQSFIVFSALGTARTDPTLTSDFKIDLDDPLEASAFALTIEDDAVVTARLDPLMPPVPISHINGQLHGEFHFAMQRGQGAQTFP
jgi:hypothetical protein